MTPNHFTTTLASLLLLASASGITGCGEASASSETELFFTAIPDKNTTELREKFQPVAAYLSEKLGVEVTYVPTASYAASVEAFKNGDVQLAWFGGLTGVQAREAVEGARAIAQGKVDPHFKSYFVAHVDTGVERSDDFPIGLAGKRFSFGSNRSTSGRLMPEAFIRQNTGQSPEEFFGHDNHYSGSHDKTALLVNAGTFEAGALNYKVYDDLVAQNKIDPEVCRVVWVTPDYADYNWTAHPRLEEIHGAGFTARLQEALLEMTEPELLQAIQREEGLIEADNEDFESIRALAEELEFLGS